MKSLPFAAILSCLILLSCSKDEESLSGSSSHSRPVKVTDYLYEMTFTDYDWKFANEFSENIDNALKGGACTIIRNGNLIGRNNDSPYCEMCEGVIHVPAAEGRYASLGVASFIVDITPKVMDNHPFGKLVDIMPFAMTDGINEKGVFCAVNSVPVADVPWTTGTNPGKKDVCTGMAVRFVLDNAASAEEACELLSEVNLKHSTVFREMHILVADKKDTFIIETIGNEMFVVEPEYPIMTNFYHSLDHYTPHACGIERYELAKESYDTTDSIEGLHNLMYRLKYSNCYDRSVSPFWYSDFYLNHSMLFGKDITIDTPTSEYDADIDKEIELFKNRKRNVLLNLWITTHSSIYDIDNLSLRVCVQEDFIHPYQFCL